MKNDPILDAMRAAVVAGRSMRSRQVRAAKAKKDAAAIFDAQRAECSFDELSLFAVRLDQKTKENSEQHTDDGMPI